jgi:3-hydroxyisobutyrate dehydrogenase-like beta-hydroxyacid dehydrogenase
MSTVSPSYSQRVSELLKKHHIFFIEAPVSGSKKPAEDASLVILAGGDQKQVDRFEPLLLKMGKKVIYCGDVGQGSCMKMVVNLLLGIMMEGLCEAINFGQKCGLSMKHMQDALLSGPMGCGLFQLKSGMLESNEYPAQFPLKHMTKDIRFAIQTADHAGAAAPVGHAVFQLFRQGVGHDLGDLDVAAIKKVLEAVSDQ